MLDRWKASTRALKREVYALYLAGKHPRTPWYARLVVVCVVGYAFSPIDLVPDPIPVLGYLDDLVLVPLGILLAVRLIPPAVLAECRAQADAAAGRPTNWVAAGVIVAIWLLLAALAVIVVVRFADG